MPSAACACQYDNRQNHKEGTEKHEFPRIAINDVAGCCGKWRSSGIYDTHNGHVSDGYCAPSDLASWKGFGNLALQTHKKFIKLQHKKVKSKSMVSDNLQGSLVYNTTYVQNWSNTVSIKIPENDISEQTSHHLVQGNSICCCCFTAPSHPIFIKLSLILNAHTHNKNEIITLKEKQIRSMIQSIARQTYQYLWKLHLILFYYIYIYPCWLWII